MDKKKEQLIVYFYEKLKSNVFDENDVYSFLILLREDAPKKSPIREFGDFIAHREKDRGYIKEYLLRTKTILDNLGKVSTIMVIKPVFTLDEIKKSLNDILTKKKLNILSDEVISNMILCIISLLQDVSINDNNNRNIGKLVFSIDKNEVILLGKVRVQNKVDAVFPALSIKNTYEELSNTDAPLTLTRIVEVKCVDGKHKIVLTKHSLTD